MPAPRQLYLALAALLVSFGFLYRDILAGLARDWSTDDNFSHGFIVAPLALYFVWDRRARLAAIPLKPSWIGLAVAAVSVAGLIAGILGAEYFVSRVSLIGVIVGAVIYLLGWQHLRALTLPIAFLLLMIPIPAIIFNQIAFPLQLLASRFGETTLHLAAIPVLREGNIIHLASTDLEVAEACSGIRSLTTLITLGVVFGYFSGARMWPRVLLVLATIPVAILTNGMRVAGTGIAAHYYGAEAAQGFFHSFSGWLMFGVAFVMLLIIHAVITKLAARWPAPARLEPELTH